MSKTHSKSHIWDLPIENEKNLELQMIVVIAAFAITITMAWVFMSMLLQQHLVQKTDASFDILQTKIESGMIESETAVGIFSNVARAMILQGDDADEMQAYINEASRFIISNTRLSTNLNGIYGYFESFPGGGIFMNGVGWEVTDDYIPTERPWYREAVESSTGSGYTLPFKDVVTGQFVFTYTQRIADDSDRTLAVIGSDISLDLIAGKVVGTNIIEGGYGLLLDASMSVIAHPEDRFIEMNLRDVSADMLLIADDLDRGEPISGRVINNYNGIRSNIYFRQLDNGWYLGMVTPTDAYFRDMRNMAIALSAFGLLMAILLCYILYRLSIAKDQSDYENIQKSKFLATMSHEIRTPMNAILGIAEIQLKEGELSPGVQDAIDKIYSSGYTLLSIINDILDLSKIEAGKLEIVTERYEVASMLSDAVHLNLIRLASKRIEFRLDVHENVPSELLGDEIRIKQILNNILTNAFKYTDKGEVVLSVYTEEADSKNDNETTLVLRVSDTGHGMTQEQIRLIFEEYARFNTEANRLVEGTGLGMNITQRLTQLMNGRIGVESTLGVGSVFTVWLPQGVASAETLGHEMIENLGQLNFGSVSKIRRARLVREPMPYGSVLIVDDVETNIYVAKGLLSAYDLKIDTATSGFDAIAKIKAGAAYDLIFMDHMMPGMDGIEAVGIIRGMEYNRPIVALTANALSGFSEMFLANGFDGFVSKPIDIRELNAVLIKHVRDKRAPEEIEAVRRQQFEMREEAAVSIGVVDSVVNIDELAMSDSKMAKMFVRDAESAIAVMEKVSEKWDSCTEDDLQAYTVSVHTAKSILALIGEMELSLVALALEQQSRDRNIDELREETPSFIKALSEIVDKARPSEELSEDAVDENRELLLEKLKIITHACEDYNKKAARDTLAELEKMEWSGATRKLLDTIEQHMLHSDFDEVAEAIAIFQKKY